MSNVCHYNLDEVILLTCQMNQTGVQLGVRVGPVGGRNPAATEYQTGIQDCRTGATPNLVSK